MSQVFPESRVVHPVEQESFRRPRPRLDADPVLVIGPPARFVGAAGPEAALRASRPPAVNSVSEKGVSAVTATAVDPLPYHPTPTPLAAEASTTTEATAPVKETS
ncbi:precorrin-8X methylmutase [Streptomyces sp. NPDC102279]|uniref:precorrin-8X methylmutase n=1 Tax=Streptomyces sp. NPDC102279 TaxID=3366153 RepID=UPI003806DE3A